MLITKPRIDKEALLSEANPLDIANYLGMEVVKKGSHYFIPCPSHERVLGKPDNVASNCILTEKGYMCFACHAHGNVIDMTMDYTGCNYPKALETIADACGGVSLFRTNEKIEKLEKITLSADDLKLLELSPMHKETPILGVLDSGIIPEDCKGTVKTKNNEYVICQKSIPQSIALLYQENKIAYYKLVIRKAKNAAIKYQNAIETLCSRDAVNANLVYNVFSENDSLDSNIFYELQNAYQKKLWRAKEILETHEQLLKEAKKKAVSK